MDILVDSEANCRLLVDEFQSLGWKVVKDAYGDFGRLNIVLKKKKAEVDLVYSPHATRCFLETGEIVPVNFLGSEVSVLSPEALLLCKLAQISSPKRTSKKRARDSVAIGKLRSMANLTKITALAASLGKEYWNGGSY